MLSTVARTLRTNTIKRTAFPITTLIRTKVTLPDLPYDYNVRQHALFVSSH
jgi:Fe-Mn family superoxide dismutase